MESVPTVINKRADVLSKIAELFPLLSSEDKEIADNLHNLALELDMKIGFGNIRGNAANTKMNYDITYSAKKPFTRSIFVIKICVTQGEANASFSVKPKLLNLDKYRPIAEACSDNIKNVIKNIKECKKCSMTCVQQVVFTFDGILYNACTYGGEVFANLATDEWSLLHTLILEEYKAHTAT